MAAKQHNKDHEQKTVLIVVAVLVGGYLVIKLLPALLNRLKPAAPAGGLPVGGGGTDYLAGYNPYQQPQQQQSGGPSFGASLGSSPNNSNRLPQAQNPYSSDLPSSNIADLIGDSNLTDASLNTLGGFYNVQGGYTFDGSSFLSDLLPDLDSFIQGNGSTGLLSEGSLSGLPDSSYSVYSPQDNAISSSYDADPSSDDTAASQQNDVSGYDNSGDSGGDSGGDDNGGDSGGDDGGGGEDQSDGDTGY
jgi:hypothetical protein